MGIIERKRAMPAASERPPAAVPQGRIALRLRDERRKQGLSLDDVAEALRIRKTYISAIENERFAELPGPAYALGFVGSYAQLLDLDRSVVVARFRDEFAGVNTETELKFPMPLKDGRFPGRAILMASIMLAIAVYGGWFAYTSSSAYRGSGTPVASTGQPASQPAGVKPAVAKPTKARLKKDDKAAAVIPAASQADVAALLRAVRSSATAKQGASPLDRKKSRRKLKTAARAEAHKAHKAHKAKPVKAAATATPASGKARIVLKALQDTWVRIQLADGTKVISRILKAGDSYAVLKNRGLVLTAGNAGGLRIIVDGRTLPALGPNGAVRQGIRLDADALLASR